MTQAARQFRFETVGSIDSAVVGVGSGGPMFTVGAFGMRGVVDALQRRFGVQAGGVVVSERTYYDTFDWRLHAQRLQLVSTPDEDGYEVELRRLEGGAARRGVVVGELGLAVDLPAGPLRAQLEPIISVRRLLPVAKVRHRARVLRVLDGECKTVARIRVEERTAIEPSTDARHPLPSALRIIPVRGYKKNLKKLTRFVEGDLGLDRARGDECALALSTIGRVPGDSTPKLPVALDGEMRADAAMKATYRVLLEAIRHNVDGTRAGLDSEFLHDLRVAVRRTRAALSQVRGVFPSATVERFKRDLKWIGEITGPTRDLDVYLIKFPTYLGWASPADREVLEPLRVFLEQEHASEHARLAAALGSNRFKTVLDAWQGYLEKPVPVRSTLDCATQPVAAVASSRIWSVYRKVIKEGRAITDATPGEAVHDLRLRCKKLRYLMELFRGLFPERAITAPIKALKRLQENLGDFNDYEVQQLALEGFATRMAVGPNPPVSTLMAMGRLADLMRQGQARARSEFSQRFDRFDRPEVLTLFRDLFATPHQEKTE